MIMKRITLLFAFLAALAFVACEQEVEGPKYTGKGVSFQSTVQSVTCTPETKAISVSLQRAESGSVLVVPFSLKDPSGLIVDTVTRSFNFAAEQLETSISLAIDASKDLSSISNITFALTDTSQWAVTGISTLTLSIGIVYEFIGYAEVISEWWSGSTDPVDVELYQGVDFTTSYKLIDPFLLLDGEEGEGFEFKFKVEGDNISGNAMQQWSAGYSTYGMSVFGGDIIEGGVRLKINYGTKTTPPTAPKGYFYVYWPLEPGPVEGVSLGDDFELPVGTSKELRPLFTPKAVLNDTVTWESSNEDVATVSKTGVVTAVANGTAVITVTTKDGGHKGSVTVTVFSPVGGISLNYTELFMAIGYKDSLKATLNPTTASISTMSWASDNHSVATVDDKGEVTPVGEGKANIVVITTDGKYMAVCEVNVENAKVDSVKFGSDTLFVAKGKETQLKYDYYPKKDYSRLLGVWASTNNGVATVTKGNVKGIANGEADITLTALGKSAKCVVFVYTPIDSISLDQKKANVVKGGTLQLTATVVKPTDGNEEIVWSSSDKNIATVSKTGLVTVKSDAEVGKEVVITAKSKFGGVSASCTVTVTAE